MFHSIPFINNGRTRRPLTPIKYIEKTVSTIDSDNTKEYIYRKKTKIKNVECVNPSNSAYYIYSPACQTLPPTIVGGG